MYIQNRNIYMNELYEKQDYNIDQIQPPLPVNFCWNNDWQTNCTHLDKSLCFIPGAMIDLDTLLSLGREFMVCGMIEG